MRLCLDAGFSSVVSPKVSLSPKVSFSRPWCEDLNDLNGDIGELGIPRPETQICFGAEEDLLHGLSWASAAQCLSRTGSV